MKLIEVVADAGYADTVAGIAEQHQVLDIWQAPTAEDGRCAIRLLVGPENSQVVLDALQGVLAGSDTARIVLSPVEAVLPRPPEPPAPPTGRAPVAGATREELYEEIERGARLDGNFLVLVVLSTVVAAVGLVKDNVAAVVGAMVIAPLLGPNLALALGTALGDSELMWRALRTNLAGLSLALVCAIAMGWLWPVDLHSHELISRTVVGMDGVVLALASGAAAVLSLTTGLPTVLVGVMVAVALLPPTATLGLLLGGGQVHLAFGAGLLLAVNVVCVNLSAKLVFLVKGIKPRTWLEKRKARQSMTTYVVIWLVSLAILVTAIYLHAT
ncbi:MAG: TIGR00341 family protein [Chromatiales bacterium 21-64-14]|nr:MAG: TIGR00341 family protein [Chromatiales bacterium 21-64-14]HQU14541.1 TIGR00341 family protein [Gammaproteobacteria bacterium]